MAKSASNIVLKTINYVVYQAQKDIKCGSCNAIIKAGTFFVRAKCGEKYHRVNKAVCNACEPFSEMHTGHRDISASDIDMITIMGEFPKEDIVSHITLSKQAGKWMVHPHPCNSRCERDNLSLRANTPEDIIKACHPGVTKIWI